MTIGWKTSKLFKVKNMSKKFPKTQKIKILKVANRLKWTVCLQ